QYISLYLCLLRLTISFCFFYSASFSFFFFFFYCYGNHRDLHSFPTRRSSDLSPSVGSRIPQSIRSVVDFPAPLGPRKPYSSPPLDRKSTRLNSSHVSISYAVFCLKKKKKNDKN